MHAGWKKNIPTKRTPKYKVGDRVRFAMYRSSEEQVYEILQVYAEGEEIPRYLCSNGRYKRMLFEDDVKGV